METNPDLHDDDMPDEIDFTQGTRGRFHRPDMQLNLPIYLDENVHDKLTQLARNKGIELSVLVNELLRKDIELIEIGH